MPLYEYICSCDKKPIEIIALKYEPSTYITCPKCGKRAKKIISLPNTDLVNNERFSGAMGVNIRQIEQAKKIYPGSEYDKKGRLLIKNRKHKLYEAKRRGLSELD
jgi:putative FmdB family regulatory protein